MRKRRIIVGLLMFLALIGIGCGSKDEEKAGVYDIYYLDRDENHISTVAYETDIGEDDIQTQIRKFINNK